MLNPKVDKKPLKYLKRWKIEESWTERSGIESFKDKVKIVESDMGEVEELLLDLTDIGYKVEINLSPMTYAKIQYHRYQNKSLKVPEFIVEITKKGSYYNFYGGTIDNTYSTPYKEEVDSIIYRMLEYIESKGYILYYTAHGKQEMAPTEFMFLKYPTNYSFLFGYTN